MSFHFEDFTEIEYRALIREAKSKWDFISFCDTERPGRVCLWRHDVDMSLHRALRLAEIEADEGVRSTYFILLHSFFYSPLELEASQIIFKIMGLGHKIGLHFDPGFYFELMSKNQSPERMSKFLKAERELLELTFDTQISAFSFHNPDVGNWMALDQSSMGGMINTYGKSIRDKFTYCSDSNGYWRHRRLKDLISQGTDDRIHILTHPEWWTPEASSPNQRVQRCVQGRAAKSWAQYMATLKLAGRIDVE